MPRSTTVLEGQAAVPDATAPAQHYREVRGLMRGLAVLRALNAMPGGIGGVVALARATGLHRTTVKRLLETLRAEGLVHHKDDGASYALGFEVRRLSEGYVGADWIDLIAAPAMNEHLRALRWPSDLATPDGGFMIVRESTHRASFLSQHRATIGIRIPMLVSSLGRAWLAWCSDEAREQTLELLSQRAGPYQKMAQDAGAVRRMLDETRERGYALNRGEWAAQSDVLAMGLPIVVGGYVGTRPGDPFKAGDALGAINLVLQRDVVNEQDLTQKYLPLLWRLATEISSRLT